MRAALAQAGLELDERCAQYGPIDLAAAAGDDAAPARAEERPTAVVSTNDVFAVGGMIACREEGVRIPDEISITGVDNTDLGATQTPAADQHPHADRRDRPAAAEQVIARLEGRPHAAFQTLPFELVSAAAPRRRPADTAASSCPAPRCSRRPRPAPPSATSSALARQPLDQRIERRHAAHGVRMGDDGCDRVHRAAAPAHVARKRARVAQRPRLEPGLAAGRTLAQADSSGCRRRPRSAANRPPATRTEREPA